MPEQDVVIRLSGVDKTYPLYANERQRALDQLGLYRLLPWGRPKVVAFHALHGIDLTVRRGERLGIMGRNGAGKTTLLKLITGNFAPTRGEVDVRGRVHALMQTGLGFHPEFTGYDNLRSALVYCGLSGSELGEAVEDVIDFVELGEFLHQPVTTYSSGMAARLHFAVATAVRPDILLIDEVMGAGDAYFTMKSVQRVQRLADTGCTLLLVSHYTQHILRFCDRALWLRDGAICKQGKAMDVASAYEVYLEREAARGFLGLAPVAGEARDTDIEREISHDDFLDVLADGRQVHRWPSRRGVKIDSLALTSRGVVVSNVSTGAPLDLDFDLRIEEGGDYGCCYFVTLWHPDGTRVARIESPVDSFHGERAERRHVRVALGPVLLGEGDYVASFSIYDRKNFSTTAHGNECRYDVIARCLSFHVDDPENPRKPVFHQPGHWAFSAA